MTKLPVFHQELEFWAGQQPWPSSPEPGNKYRSYVGRYTYSIYSTGTGYHNTSRIDLRSIVFPDPN